MPVSPLILLILQFNYHVFWEDIKMLAAKVCQIRQIKIQGAWYNLNFRKNNILVVTHTIF